MTAYDAQQVRPFREANPAAQAEKAARGGLAFPSVFAGFDWPDLPRLTAHRAAVRRICRSGTDFFIDRKSAR
jgi:hypothetical protein